MVTRNSVRWMLVACLILVSCTSTPSSSPMPVPSAVVEPTALAPETPTALPDYVMKVRNSEYQLGAVDIPRTVHLTDGVFQEGTPGNTDFVDVRMTDFVTSGDLNADGTKEIAALVAENYGGSGVFVFLVVYSDVSGILVFQTSTMVDDRPQLNALSIETGEIFLDAVIHGVDEPMCCPTLRTTRHYRLTTGNQLDMTDYATFTPAGDPRTIKIESPSNGADTFSSIQIKGSVAIAPFENTLAYRIYDVGGVEVSAGAITVSAPDPGGSGTFDALVPLGNILSGAVVRVEVQDISAADGSLLAMDSVELVVK